MFVITVTWRRCYEAPPPVVTQILMRGNSVGGAWVPGMAQGSHFAALVKMCPGGAPGKTRGGSHWAVTRVGDRVRAGHRPCCAVACAHLGAEGLVHVQPRRARRVLREGSRELQEPRGPARARAVSRLAADAHSVPSKAQSSSRRHFLTLGQAYNELFESRESV